MTPTQVHMINTTLFPRKRNMFMRCIGFLCRLVFIVIFLLIAIFWVAGLVKG